MKVPLSMPALHLASRACPVHCWARLPGHRLRLSVYRANRYVAENHFEFVLPPEIEAVPEAKAEYLRAWRRTRGTTSG